MLKTTTKTLITAESVVGEQVICVYNAQIDHDNIENIIFTQRQTDKELYKANRKVCREDQAAFEDMAYNLQDAIAAFSNK